jgi:two-component system chemotaxis response regulator CheB
VQVSDAQGRAPRVAAAPSSSTLRVVVVDDSAAQRRFLRTALEADGDVEVVGEAANGSEAVGLVARLRPAAVLLDLHLPVMGGLEAIEQIMAASPTPIVVWSAFVTGADRDNGIEALAAGAVEVVPKPGVDDVDLDHYADALRRRLRVAARVRVITHPRGRLRATDARVRILPPAASGLRGRDPGVRLLVLGASTGGPQAVLTVLSGLPVNLQPAVLVVQHMAASFVPGMVAWLDDMLPLPVLVGGDGDTLYPGTVTVAPSGGNVVLRDERLRIACVPAPPGQHHVPGIDVTLSSVAEVLGPRAVGVLLTGMGKDGAAGLLAMREKGATTIAQDEASCAVYGMPAAAVALGAAEQQLPVSDIAAAVLAAAGLART